MKNLGYFFRTKTGSFKILKSSIPSLRFFGIQEKQNQQKIPNHTVQEKHYRHFFLGDEPIYIVNR